MKRRRAVWTRERRRYWSVVIDDGQTTAGRPEYYETPVPMYRPDGSTVHPAAARRMALMMWALRGGQAYRVRADARRASRAKIEEYEADWGAMVGWEALADRSVAPGAVGAGEWLQCAVACSFGAGGFDRDPLGRVGSA